MKKPGILFATLCICLLAQLPAAAQKPNPRYDALSYWEFDLTDDAHAPACTYLRRSNELFLAGFDVEEDSIFYFAGGDPLAVTCFEGTRLKWRRQVSDRPSSGSLFRVRNDSVYLVEGRTREFIALHKSGKGDIRKAKLPLSEVWAGVMKEEYFVAGERVPTIHGTDTVFTYQDPIKLYYFNYVPQLTRTRIVKAEESDSILTSAPRARLPKDGTYYYQGSYKEYAIFTPPSEAGVWDMYFTKINHDTCLAERVYHMEEIKPFDVFAVPARGNSPSFEFIRGNHYYAVGSDSDKGTLIVSAIDLGKALKESKPVPVTPSAPSAAPRKPCTCIDCPIKQTNTSQAVTPTPAESAIIKEVEKPRTPFWKASYYYNEWNKNPHKDALVNRWVYAYKGSGDTVSFQHFMKKPRERVVLCGYDTDDNGTFYFAGGDPVYISCFKGEKLLYRRQLPGCRPVTAGAFRLRGDSLYLIDQENRVLVSIHKSGKGVICRKPLDIPPIVDGALRADTILLACKVAHASYENDFYYFDYQGKFLKKTSVTSNEASRLWPPYFSIWNSRYPDERRYDYDYKGTWKGYPVIYGPVPDYCEIALLDKRTKQVIRSFRYPSVLKHDCTGTIPFCSVEVKKEGGKVIAATPATDLLRGDHFYTVWYHPCEKGEMYITEIDLDKAFPGIQ